MKVKIKHIDGIKDVWATPSIVGNGVNLEYRLDGMTYGVTLTLQEAIKTGVIKKVRANNSFRDMKEGSVYPIISVSYSEDDFVCETGDMIIAIECGKLHYSNFIAVI